MKRLRVFASFAFASFALLLLSTPADAQDPTPEQAEAKRLFDEARTLSAAERHGEACELLARSQKIDPSMGTEFYLAECLEKTGRLVAARDHYLHVAEIARASSRNDRAAFAIERLESLEARIPTLTVTVPEAARVPGLVVEVQGAPIAEARWGAPLIEDPGNVQWSARAPGRAPRAGTVALVEKDQKTLTIEPLDPAAATRPGADGSNAPVSEPADGTQLALGIVVGATGVAGVGVGAVFGLLALDDYGASEDGPCDAQQRCTAAGLALRSDADTEATVSTIGFIAGGVLAAGGLVLVLTAPSGPAESTVGLRVRPSGGDVVWRF